MSWEEKAKAKREAINSAIPEKWRLTTPIPSPKEQLDVTGHFIRQFLDEKEIEITETDAVEILQRISSGTWTSENVTTAFCHRAAVAHQLVSCLHEIFFDQAIEDAIALDRYYAKYGRTIGPLHGLPVSLKDCFHVKGVETTNGYVGWIGTFQGKIGTGKEKVYESQLVTELRALGAVLYCKTSVPHSLIAAETMNNIIGTTWNPKNRNLSPGGSSGGEGALLSLCGSPIGFGGDSGGSIRMPASFNGLYGIRTTPGRLPYQGLATSLDGFNTVSSVIGPMSQSAGALRYMMKAVLSQKPWLHDPLVVEMPWRREQELEAMDSVTSPVTERRRLVFGLLRNDGVVQLHPPVKRALDIVENVLVNQGYGIVDWKPPSHYRAIQIIQASWVYDGGKSIFDHFSASGEPVSDQIASIYGKELREEWAFTKVAKNNVAKREYEKEYLDYWNSTESQAGTGRPVDAIIAPVAEIAATRPGGLTYGGYTTAFSALDYTIVTVPVTTVQKDKDVVDTAFQPLNDFDSKVQAGYDPDLYDGAYVGVQLIGRKFQEEKILVLAEHLGDLIASHREQNLRDPATTYLKPALA